MNLLLKFLQSSTSFSSKRLMGVESGNIFVALCAFGCYVFRHDEDTYKDILFLLGSYSAALLGAGLFEKRNDNAKKTDIVDGGNSVNFESQSEDLPSLPEDARKSGANGPTKRRNKK